MTPSASNPIQILLLNNDAIARAGVKLLLENKPGFKVVGQAGEKEQALKLVEQKHPDIILVHGCMDEPLGTGLFTELLAISKKPRIILVTPQCDPQYHMEAVKNGAVGILVTENHPEVLFKAIEKVHAGEVWLDRSLIASFVTQRNHPNTPAYMEPKTARIAQLSQRERGDHRLDRGRPQEPADCRPALPERGDGAPSPDLDLQKTGHLGPPGTGHLRLPEQPGAPAGIKPGTNPSSKCF